MHGILKKLLKKFNTLLHLNWRWAYTYYKKRFVIYSTYYLSKLCGRTFWEMSLDGVKVKFGFSNPYQHHIGKIYNRAVHETQLLIMWKRKAEQSNVILDLGGYIGVFGLLAAVANPRAKVFIFEPDPVNAEQIRNNICLNNLTNVTIEQMAISDTAGTVSFEVSFKGSGQNGGGTGGTITKGNGEYQVECINIDIWAEKNNLIPDLIKFDIEGAEYRGLVGGEKILNKYDVNILLELHQNFLQRFGDSPSDVHCFLQKMNYGTIWLDEDRFCTHYWVYKTKHASFVAVN